MTEGSGTVTLSALRSGGDMTRQMSAVIEVSGAASRGDDCRVPGGVTFPANECVAQVVVTLLKDDATEAPEGNAAWGEDAVIRISPGGTSYVAAGQPATVTIADDASWWYSDWESVKRPMPFTATQIGQPQAVSLGQGGDFERWTWHQCCEWRYLGLTDTSDDWGQAADITGQSVTLTDERTVGAGLTVDLSLEAIGAPLTTGGTFYGERTTGTGVTRNAADGRTPTERNAIFQVAGYGLYSYVEKRIQVFSGGQPLAGFGYVAGRADLGFTGEVSGASQNRLRRFWLDDEAPSPVAVISRPGPAAPPGPPTVIPGGS